MSRTLSPSSGRPYGLARVCRVWRASRASVYRHLSSFRPKPSRRPGPVGPMPDAALADPPPPTPPGDPRGPDREPVSRRGSPKGLGEAARGGRLHVQESCAAAHAREQSARTHVGRGTSCLLLSLVRAVVRSVPHTCPPSQER